MDIFKKSVDSLSEKNLVSNFKDKDPGSDDIPDFIKKFYKNLKTSSNTKQLTVGTIGGFSAGYVAAKFGKIAAIAIGSSLLLIQVANYNGYIEIDWKKFNQDVEAAKYTIGKNKSKLSFISLQNIGNFVKENLVLAGGFSSGFLLGLAWA